MYLYQYRKSIIVFIAIVFLCIGWYVQQLSVRQKATKEITVLNPSRPMQAFSLESATGEVFTENNLLGHWSLLFFGYTSCPDVCPTTLAALNQLDRYLKKHHIARPTFIFVSVDPERDSPKGLREYVEWFNQSFFGLTGKPSELTKITKQLGVMYQTVPLESSLGEKVYAIDHSASISIISPKGEFYAVFSTPFNIEHIANDLKLIQSRPIS